MCPIVTDQRARREALKRAGKCYNCLRPDLGKSIAQATSSTNSMILLSPQPGANIPSTSESDQSKPVPTAFVSERSGVLLQTASATIC